MTNILLIIKDVHVSLSLDAGTWAIHIGAQFDDISGRDNVRRWPNIHVSKAVGGKGEFEVKSAFGGLVFLESHSAGTLSIEVGSKFGSSC